ncbi:MAG: DUF2163 domain-containing protein [Gammaproteobacteria bacterium]|nr:MAG: DUF2163 domain-containing protein [Gammaproteobacteria bacterium]
MKLVTTDAATMVHCVRIVATDGTTFRFVSYPHDLTMSNGEVYQSDLGYEPTDIQVGTTPAGAPIFDLAGLLATNGITLDQLTSRKLDNARVYYFVTSWANPVEDEEEILLAFLGKATIQDERYKIEMMSIADALNQSVGRSFTPACPWTLFDATLDGDTIPYQRSRCTGPRSAPDGPVLADYKETGTLTGVTSQTKFADSARAEAAGYFDYGFIKFTSGNNAGLPSLPIKKHTAGGNFELYLPLHYTPVAGDAYEMIPGCNKKKTGGDCVTKYSNAINFGGFEDMAPPEAYKEFGGPQ